MSEIERKLRQRLARRLRRAGYLLAHFLITTAVFIYAQNISVCCGPSAQHDDVLAVLLSFTLIMHVGLVLGRLAWEGYVHRALKRLAPQTISQDDLQRLVEQEVARRLADYGIYADEAPKGSSPYAQDRAMRLTSDGELVELPVLDADYQPRKRTMSS